MVKGRWLLAMACVYSPGCTGTIEFDDGNLEASTASTSPLVAEEPGWTLTERFAPGGAISAHFDPLDGSLYYGGRSSEVARRGLWRIDANGNRQQVGGSFQVAGLVVDDCTGDVFLSDDFGGNIYRSAAGISAPSLWVTGFHRGDDDPVGMAIAPMGHSSGVLAPGEIALVDRGANGPDEVWAFSSASPEGERLLHPDDGTLIDGVDVAVTATAVYVSDQGAGRLYRVTDARTLERVTMPQMRPSSITVDPLSGKLLVMDLLTRSVVRLDPATGSASTVFSGLAVNADNWGSLDAYRVGASDKVRLVITERDTPAAGVISVFEYNDNRPPRAACEDVVVELGALECAATVPVGANSSDPDDDLIEIELSDPGPYPVGTTEVVVTVTDSGQLSDSCTATVTVERNATGWRADNAVSDPEVYEGESDHALVVWGFFGDGAATFDFEDVVVEAADDDSSARMFGTMRVRSDGCDGDHDGEVWTLDARFDPAPTTTAPKLELRRPEVDQPPSVTDLWRFFGLADGSRIERDDGLAWAELHQRPADLRFAFQIGDTANGKNTNFGMSGWLFYDHALANGTVRSGTGDFNLDLAPICE